MSTRERRLRDPRSDEWDPDLADALEATSAGLEGPDFSVAPDPTDLDHPFGDVDFVDETHLWEFDPEDEISPIQRALRGDAAYWGTHGVHD